MGTSSAQTHRPHPHSNSSEERIALVKELDRGLTRAGQLSNLLGGVVIFLFLAFIFPIELEAAEANAMRIRSGIALVLYMAITIPVGQRLMRRRYFEGLAGWLRAGRSASEEERTLVLRYPLISARVSAVFWTGGAVLFSLLNLSAGWDVVVAIAAGILLGGLTACALQYLLDERVLRQTTEYALAGAPSNLESPGVAARLLLVWLLATGIPLLGLVAIAGGYLLGADFDLHETVEAAAFLGCLAFAVGLAGLLIAARSVADPLTSLRGALEQLQQGDFSARVPVDDGSEVGLLQAGFNQMAGGLAERERLREAFGAYVDPDLAERVLVEGTDLAGEEVEVTVLFMDVRDFTGLSERTGAREVVTKLNALYAVVVPIVTAHGGHANKFIGDGLLAVFGAPVRLEDHAKRAAQAAREVVALNRDRRQELRVGVGVNTGPVMAGTIGGGGRLDFTVIGDTVNTAARVEAATRETGDDLLITEATLQAIGSGEWSERPPIPLKGKRQAVRLFALA